MCIPAKIFLKCHSKVLCFGSGDLLFVTRSTSHFLGVKLHDNGPPSTAVNDVSLSVTFLGPFFPYSLILETFVCKESACLCHCSGYYFMKSRNNNGPRTVP